MSPDKDQQIWKESIAEFDDMPSEFQPLRIPIAYEPLTMADLLGAIVEADDLGVLSAEESQRAVGFYTDLFLISVGSDPREFLDKLPRVSAGDGSECIVLTFPRKVA